MSNQIEVKNARQLVKASPDQIDSAVSDVCEMTAVAADVNEELGYLEEAVDNFVRQRRLYTAKAKAVRSKLIKAADLLR